MNYPAEYFFREFGYVFPLDVEICIVDLEGKGESLFLWGLTIQFANDEINGPDSHHQIGQADPGCGCGKPESWRWIRTSNSKTKEELWTRNSRSSRSAFRRENTLDKSRLKWPAPVTWLKVSEISWEIERKVKTKEHTNGFVLRKPRRNEQNVEGESEFKRVLLLTLKIDKCHTEIAGSCEAELQSWLKVARDWAKCD